MREICFRDVLIIDGKGSPAFSGYVVVQGNEIVEVGRGAPNCGGMFYVEGHDLCLLPGLIDCHVHLFMDGGLDPFRVLMSQTRDQRILAGAANGLKNLYAGITTVRECGAPEGLDLMLRDSIDAGLIEGPRVVCGGRVITTTGGHGYQIGVEADSVSELVTTVRREIKAGVDLVKLMATGGFMSSASDPRIPQFDLEQMKTVVTEAHRAKKKVAAHAQALEGIRLAAQAGVDSIEHGRFLNQEVAEIMKKMGTCFVPTLTPSVLSKSAIDDANAPSWVLEKREYMENLHVTCFKIAIEARLPIAAGTDAGSLGTPHGLLSMEISTLSDLGLSPMDSICAATSWAANLLGVSNVTGTVEKGKLADLILVKGNPLDNPSILADPVLVMKDGVIYKHRLDVGMINYEKAY